MKQKKQSSKASKTPAAKRTAAKKPARSAPAAHQGALVVVLTEDAAVGRAVLSAHAGAACVRTASSLESELLTGARTILIDVRLAAENAYEVMRRLRVRSRARFALLHPAGAKADQATQAIARFSGASAVLAVPIKPAELKQFIRANADIPSPDQLLDSKESKASENDDFRDRVLKQLADPGDPQLLSSISDPETRLYSSSYGAFALDMETKRAQRFGMPLAVALVGFEGEAGTETLLELAGIFLNEIRDTDTLARFSVNSFLFLLPNTLTEGARAMLERISVSVRKRGLRDVVGDALILGGGVAAADLTGTETREQLFERANRAFEKARVESRPAVVA